MKTKLVVKSVMNHDYFKHEKTKAITAILNNWGYDYRPFVDNLWHGWPSKQEHFIKSVHELEDDVTHIMFIDAADVVLLCGEEELMDRWSDFNHPWVYNAEPHIWPHGSFLPSDYPTPDVRYRYLNAGVSLGEVAHIRKWFDKWTDSSDSLPICKRDDQYWMTEHFIKSYPDAINLDTNCDLFQCMCGSDMHTIRTPGRVHNNITNTDPSVIHFNGGTNICDEDRRGLWEHLV